MKRLARRHRIAHLRAPMAQQPAGSVRKEDLAALLREEMTVPTGKKPPPDASPFKRAEKNIEFQSPNGAIDGGTGKTQQVA
jgi:hypothetical protein